MCTRCWSHCWTTTANSAFGQWVSPPSCVDSRHATADADPLADGSYSLTTIDEFADQLLNEERVCEIQLPRLTQRRVLEETEGLAPRKSKLGKAMGVLESKPGESDDEGSERGARYLSRSPSRSLSPEVHLKEQEYWTEGSEDESEVEGEAGGAARGRSASVASGGRYMSRSPSPGGDAGGRYVSRSPSRSPPPAGEEMDVGA